MSSLLRNDRQRTVTQSILLYIGFFCLGMVFTIVGPTLLELQRLTDTTTDEIAWIFPSRSVVGLLGAVLAGLLIGLLNHWMLLGVAMIDIGVCHLFIPQMRHIIPLCVICGLSRMGASFMDAGGNMVLLKIWGSENGPWMQALHGVFGVGALVAPLLAEPFLRDGSKSTDIDVLSTPRTSFANLTESSTNPYLDNNNVNLTSAPDSLDITSYENHTVQYSSSDIHWVYFILAVSAFFSAGLMIGIAIFCSEIRIGCCNRQKGLSQESQKKKNTEQCEPTWFRMQIIVMMFCFYLFYCILEMNYGNYLTVFAVKELGWSEKEGACVTAGYWTSFTVGRILGIFLVKFIQPWKLLTGDLIVSVLSLGILVFFVSHSVVLWACTLSLGFGISTMYATGITWTEQYITMTGPAGATMMIGSSLGEMTGPVIIGFLFEKYGPTSFLYVMCAAVCVLAVLFAIMQYCAKKHGKKGKSTVSTKEAEEMETFSSTEDPTEGTL